MKTARLLLLLAVCSTTAALTQAQTVVPHTFQDGTPAEASEVNENFDALAESIDEGWGGQIVIKSAGEVLGFAFSGGFITRQGYYSSVSTDSGAIRRGYVFFENTNCSGPGYSNIVNRGAGSVFSTGVSRYWVVPLTSSLQTVNARSLLGDAQAYNNQCTIVNPVYVITVPNVVPNDPAVTGIQNKGAQGGEEYAWPITYEMR